MQKANDYSREPTVTCPVCDFAQYDFLANRYDQGPVVRCSSCRHVYLNPPPPAELLLQTNLDAHKCDDDAELFKLLDGWFREVDGAPQHALKLIEQNGGFSNKKILDVGCGPGLFLNECKKRGAEIVGMDMSKHSSGFAERNFGFSILTKSLEEALNEGALEYGKFDWITSFEVIEHVGHPVDFLKGLRKLLRPGGGLYLSTPNFYLFHSMGAAAPALSAEIVDHIHFFEPQTLSSCLTKADLEPVSVTSLQVLSFGEKQKKIAARQSIVMLLWKAIRCIGPVAWLKNWVIRKLNKVNESPAGDTYSGTQLIAFARRPR